MIESSCLGGFVGQRRVVHDDEFVERGECTLAQEGVAEDKDAIFERECFQVGEDVPLIVKEQPDRASPGGEPAHIAGRYRIQVAGAVRTAAKEEKIARKLVSMSAAFCRARRYSSAQDCQSEPAASHQSREQARPRLRDVVRRAAIR